MPLTQFIDEVDIELVNQELNFHNQDNNLIINGGCDLFTTKPIGSDRKLFKTIDKHLDQIVEDNHLSHSLERERQNSLISLFGSSMSPPHFTPSLIENRPTFSPGSLENQSLQSITTLNAKSQHLATYDGLDGGLSDESPFGPLKHAHTRKTFAYLIAILNSTYPDHDFSDLQPTTENFHKMNVAEDLIHKFNNLMLSLGKKEELLNWIWDTINVYMDFIPSRPASTSTKEAQASSDHPRHSSFSQSAPKGGSHMGTENILANSENCQIYEFQPSDQSIIEDLSYPFQTMWSYYWFIYNRKKKRVAFIYLNAINKIHYSKVKLEKSGSHEASSQRFGVSAETKNASEDDDVIYGNEYGDDDMDESDINDDVVGDIEL